MADNRIKLNSLGALEEMAPQYVQIGETVVTIKPIIPFEEVLQMIQWCIDYLVNDRPFISAPLKRIVKDFAILRFYTNFDFSFLDEYKDMTEIYEEYDLIYRYDVVDKVTPFINAKQLEFFNSTLDETMKSIIEYRNSAVGIVDALAENAKEDVNNMAGALDLISDDEKNNKMLKLLRFAEQIKNPAE